MKSGEASSKREGLARSTPLRFGVRSLLVLMLVVALGAWWWFPPVTGRVSKWTAVKVKVGMTQQEVERIVSVKPKYGWGLDTTNYSVYRVWNPPYADQSLTIAYAMNTDRVVSVEFSPWADIEE